MPTNYVFNAQNTREIANGNGLTLATGDTVLVEQGGWVKAVAPGPGDGIEIADLTNRVIINGLVESDNRNGIQIGAAGGAVTIGAGGEVRGIASGISSTGSTAIWNYGKISDTDQSNPEFRTAITVSSSATIFSLFNTGEIIGNIISYSRFKNIINSGLIQGKISFGNASDIYDGRAGTITGVVSLAGGDDVAYGGAGGETFLDGVGNDFIDGGEGIDTVRFEGVDSIAVDLRRTDRQDTGDGFETLRNVENLSIEYIGAGQTITFIGNDVANDLKTGAGADRLEGGGGNDILDGSYGNDILNGGDGFDTVVFQDAAEAGEAVFVNMANKDDTRNTYGADTYIGIEALVGTSFGDHFIGNADANTFNGGKGNDTLDGGGGVNTAVFSGHASDYTVAKNGGTITVQHNNNGQDGTDTLTNIRFARFEADNKTVALINSAPGAVSLSNATVAENAANAVVGALSSTDADGDAVSCSLAADPDGVFAIRDGHLVVTRALDFEAKTQHSVTVTAKDAWGGETSQTFTVSVTDLADTGTGGGGTPGAVNLVLRGTSGANVLVGGTGNDTLYGGLGKDVLTGGAGGDVFVFDTRPNKRTNVDTITDFVAADDSIQLDNKYLKKLGSGSASKPAKLKAAFFKAADKAKDGNDYLVYNKKTGVLSYDEDGSGAKAAVAIAKFANKASLTKDDFFVI